MTNRELVLNMLAELSAKDISEATNPETLNEHKEVARRGGNVARKARLQLEKETGQKVVTSLNAKKIKSLKETRPTTKSDLIIAANERSKKSKYINLSCRKKCNNWLPTFEAKITAGINLLFRDIILY